MRIDSLSLLMVDVVLLQHLSSHSFAFYTHAQMMSDESTIIILKIDYEPWTPMPSSPAKTTFDVFHQKCSVTARTNFGDFDSQLLLWNWYMTLDSRILNQITDADCCLNQNIDDNFLVIWSLIGKLFLYYLHSLLNWIKLDLMWRGLETYVRTWETKWIPLCTALTDDWWKQPPC